MIDVPEKILSEAERYFMLANTPTYLYENLRNVKYTKRIASNVPTDRIVEEINRIDKLEEPDLEDVVMAYLLLVSLTHKQARQVFDSLSQIGIESLKWVDKIVELWDSQRRSSNTVDISPVRPTSVEVRQSDVESTVITPS